MKLSIPTYLIAELAGDVVPLVKEMRERFNPNNVYWPADITIAGSSGVGPIKIGQNLEDVVSQLTPIIREYYFKELKFISINCFPDTGIYYLAPKRGKFDEMHQAVIRSGVEFNDSEWPYNPHCTLRWCDDDSPECSELFETMSLPVNSAIECFTLYQPQVKGGSRVHRFVRE